MTNTERERTEQRIIERGTPKDLARFREFHAQDGNSAGEPLSSVDFRLYRVVLEQNAGLPKVDAKKQTKTLRDLYQHGDDFEKQRIAGVVHSTFEGLTSERRMQPQPAFAAIGEEVVLFRRSR